MRIIMDKWSGGMSFYTISANLLLEASSSTSRILLALFILSILFNLFLIFEYCLVSFQIHL